MSDLTLEAGGACRRGRSSWTAPSPTRPNRSASRCGRDEGVPLTPSSWTAPCATRPASVWIARERYTPATHA